MAVLAYLLISSSISDFVSIIKVDNTLGVTPEINFEVYAQVPRHGIGM